jgi:hypothetical protein
MIIIEFVRLSSLLLPISPDFIIDKSIISYETGFMKRYALSVKGRAVKQRAAPADVRACRQAFEKG